MYNAEDIIVNALNTVLRQGKCVYNRTNFHTSGKVVKRLQSTVIGCPERNPEIQLPRSTA